MSVLESAWTQCFSDLGAALPPARVLSDVLARYRKPHRAYHTLQYLEECFGWFAQARHLMRAPGEVAFALFYHDAIYDTHAPDNEARSAALARTVLDRDAIETLIMATKHDAVAADGDARVLVDIDLSILGAAPERFDEYERQVRVEHAWVESEAFRKGRSRILREFLARPALYNTALFRERLEAQARASLARSLATLGATV